MRTGILYRCLPVLIVLLVPAKFIAQDKPAWKQDTVIGDDVFNKYNNWLSVGAGVAKNSQFGGEQFTGGLDYNFHIRKEYFQFGVLVSGDQFGEYSTYEYHFCYGKRSEEGIYNFSYFAGLSFSELFEREGNGYAQNPVYDPGLYIAGELIRKLTYDIGIGTSAFVDINPRQIIPGLKIDLYFSGAYKGKKENFYY